MKICGIISEYNPFHNGHLYQINKIKEILNPDLIVVIMSGNFVQRGEISIVDKWQRCECALNHGVDLVIELPTHIATQSANFFAKGACELLKLLKVTHLCFGSESNNLSLLKELAKADITLDLKDGISNCKAYELAYGDLKSNDILGLNYIKNILNTNIIPITIKRENNNYLDENLNGNISSATSIRKACLNNQDYSLATPMKIHNPLSNDQFYNLLKVIIQTNDHLDKIFLVDEGIENWYFKNIKISNNYNEFISNCTSKRYSKARIQRSLIQIMANITKEEINNLDKINYLRVLGFNSKGQQYLKTIKNDVNIVTNFAKIPDQFKALEDKYLALYKYLNINYNEFRPIIIKDERDD